MFVQHAACSCPREAQDNNNSAVRNGREGGKEREAEARLRLSKPIWSCVLVLTARRPLLSTKLSEFVRVRKADNKTCVTWRKIIGRDGGKRFCNSANDDEGRLNERRNGASASTGHHTTSPRGSDLISRRKLRAAPLLAVALATGINEKCTALRC